MEKNQKSEKNEKNEKNEKTSFSFQSIETEESGWDKLSSKIKSFFYEAKWSTLKIWASEKVDGSNFCFRINKDGSVTFINKRNIITEEKAKKNKHWSKTYQCINELNNKKHFQGFEGYEFYGEAFHDKKVSRVIYQRIPKHHFVLYEVKDPSHKYLDYLEIEELAKKLDLESSPCIFSNYEKPLKNLKFDEVLNEIENGKIVSFLSLSTTVKKPKPEGFVVHIIDPEKNKKSRIKFVRKSWAEVNEKETDPLKKYINVNRMMKMSTNNNGTEDKSILVEEFKKDLLKEWPCLVNSLTEEKLQQICIKSYEQFISLIKTKEKLDN